MSAAGKLGGLALLVVPCFALGAGVGLLVQDPGLLGSYLMGRTERVALEVEVPALDAPVEEGVELPELPAVAAAPEPRAPEPPAAPAPSPSTGAGGFVVQVGAFGDRAGADRLAAALRGKGYAVGVSRAESGSSWRVRVGPLGSREEGERAAARLQSEEKLPTWVLQEGG